MWHQYLLGKLFKTKNGASANNEIQNIALELSQNEATYPLKLRILKIIFYGTLTLIFIALLLIPYLILSIYVFNPIHDYFFLEHSFFNEATEEREYINNWQLLGNPFAFVTGLLQLYLVYKFVTYFYGFLKKYENRIEFLINELESKEDREFYLKRELNLSLIDSDLLDKYNSGLIDEVRAREISILRKYVKQNKLIAIDVESISKHVREDFDIGLIDDETSKEIISLYSQININKSTSQKFN